MISLHPPTWNVHPYGVARGLGRVNGRWGSVLVQRDRSARFTSLADGPDEALGVMPPTLPPCATRPAPDATLVWIESNEIPSAVLGNANGRARVGVDLRADGACVFEASRAGMWYDADQAPARSEVHVQGGALVGHPGSRPEMTTRCELAR